MRRSAVVVVGGLALLALSQWLRLGPRSAEASAEESYRRGDYARALSEFQRAAGEGADPNRATFNQAAALYRLEHFGDAEARYGGAADGDAYRKARAAYDRGNCALHEACRGDGAADPRLLGQAMEAYRACLQQEAASGGDHALFQDARHNLELAKLLRSGNGSAPGQQSAKKGQDSSGKRELANQQKKDPSSGGSAGQAAKRAMSRDALKDMVAALTPEQGTSKPKPPKPPQQSSCPT